MRIAAYYAVLSQAALRIDVKKSFLRFFKYFCHVFLRFLTFFILFFIFCLTHVDMQDRA